MANLLDYLTWRGDLSFAERPFNEVDNLVFSELAYIELDGIVPGPEEERSVSLEEVAGAYALREQKQEDLFFNDPAPLLASAGRSVRFSPVRLCRFVNHIDSERQVQFSAVCFLLPDGTVYVAFRGTDNSVVGWREDFNFSFSEETEGQKEAVDYLEAAAAVFPGDFRIGGHSKGGNLAVYAAAFCDPALRSRFLRIYSNDGPGFMETVASSEAYLSVLGLVELFIPEASVVGILLNNGGRKTILRSSASGVLQHNPMTWQVLGTAFETVDSQAPASAFMDKTLHRWLDGLTPEQRKNVVTTLFDAMDASGARTLSDLSANRWDTYSALLKTIFEMEPGRRMEIFSTLFRFSSVSHDVLWSEAKASFTQRIEKAVQRLKKPEQSSGTAPESK